MFRYNKTSTFQGYIFLGGDINDTIANILLQMYTLNIFKLM